MSSNPIIHFLQQILTLNGTYNWSYVWAIFLRPTCCRAW